MIIEASVRPVEDIRAMNKMNRSGKDLECESVPAVVMIKGEGIGGKNSSMMLPIKTKISMGNTFSRLRIC